MPTPRPDRPRRRRLSSAAWLLLLLPLLVASVGLGLWPVSPAAGQASRAVAWERYDVTIELRQDGRLHVVERQVVQFRGGPFSSGFADIPMARIDRIENVQVGEESAAGSVAYERLAGCCVDGLPLEIYQTGVVDDFTSIRWGFPSATNEQRTFLVEYDAVGALRVYGEDASGEPPNQQLWWTAIPREATEVAPVQAATVTVRLPAAVDPAAVVVGQGEAVVPAAEHTADGRTWTWQATGLGAGDELIVRLQFPPLVAAAPPAWQRADDDRRQRAEEAVARRAQVNALFLGGGLLTLVGGGVLLFGAW